MIDVFVDKMIVFGNKNNQGFENDRGRMIKKRIMSSTGGIFYLITLFFKDIMLILKCSIQCSVLKFSKTENSLYQPLI